MQTVPQHWPGRAKTALGVVRCLDELFTVLDDFLLICTEVGVSPHSIDSIQIHAPHCSVCSNFATTLIFACNCTDNCCKCICLFACSCYLDLVFSFVFYLYLQLHLWLRNVLIMQQFVGFNLMLVIYKIQEFNM